MLFVTEVGRQVVESSVEYEMQDFIEVAEKPEPVVRGMAVPRKQQSCACCTAFNRLLQYMGGIVYYNGGKHIEKCCFV